MSETAKKRYDEIEYPEIYANIRRKREEQNISGHTAYQKKNWLPQFQGKIETPEYSSTI